MASSEVSTMVAEHHKTEEEKRREHLDSLTADSDVRAPGLGKRIKEEVQAIAHSIYGKLCVSNKGKTNS